MQSWCVIGRWHWLTHRSCCRWRRLPNSGNSTLIGERDATPFLLFDAGAQIGTSDATSMGKLEKNLYLHLTVTLRSFDWISMKWTLWIVYCGDHSWGPRSCLLKATRPIQVKIMMEKFKPKILIYSLTYAGMKFKNFFKESVIFNFV